MTKRENMYRAIETHGENLKFIFGLNIDAVVLSKKVHRIEVFAHKKTEDYCNGLIETDEWDSMAEKILKRLDSLLHFRDKGIPVVVNTDARGYALKIPAEYVTEHNMRIYTDWGNNGILAPEFN